MLYNCYSAAYRSARSIIIIIINNYQSKQTWSNKANVTLLSTNSSTWSLLWHPLVTQTCYSSQRPLTLTSPWFIPCPWCTGSHADAITIYPQLLLSRLSSSVPPPQVVCNCISPCFPWSPCSPPKLCYPVGTQTCYTRPNQSSLLLLSMLFNLDWPILLLTSSLVIFFCQDTPRTLHCHIWRGSSSGWRQWPQFTTT